MHRPQRSPRGDGGWYDDDEERSPWRVILYIDRDSDPLQQQAPSGCGFAADFAYSSDD